MSESQTTAESSGPATTRPLALAETIAAKDLNNLYLTSCYFTDSKKYAAFCELYALMRVIDDRIDELPLRSAVTEADRRREHAVVEAWEGALFATLEDRPAAGDIAARCDFAAARPLVAASAAAMRRFPFPPELWRNFFAAMHRDIDEPRFATYPDFLDYTEGASVAPTTIYLYLIAARDDAGSDVYLPPPDFELRRCGQHLGLSSYLAHILRDLAKDLATGRVGLLYLARDDLERFGLDERRLRQDLDRRVASPELRRLVAELIARARESGRRGAELLGALEGRLAPDCAFILDLIRVIYDRLLDKLEAVDCDPFGGRHQLTLEEKYEAAQRAARRHGISLADAVASPFAGVSG